MGIRGEGNGLHMQIFQTTTQRKEFLYRSKKEMSDYNGGKQWLPYTVFEDGDYERFASQAGGGDELCRLML